MKLSIRERLGLLELLPSEDGYSALKAIRRAKESLSPTPQEIKDYDFQQVPHGNGFTVKWDVEKEKIKDIPLDEFVTDKVRNILVKMDKDNKLTDATFGLYEKFVVAYRNTEVAHTK